MNLFSRENVVVVQHNVIHKECTIIYAQCSGWLCQSAANPVHLGASLFLWRIQGKELVLKAR